MSVGMISFYSFISGVGSCAAFQAALKTGKPLKSHKQASANTRSNFELAYTPRDGDGISFSSVWIKRLLLHTYRRHCVPRQHLRPAYHAFACDFATCSCFDTLPHRCRPQEGSQLHRTSHHRADPPQLQRAAPDRPQPHQVQRHRTASARSQ